MIVNHHEARAHPKHRLRPQRLKVTANPNAHGEDLPVFHARLMRDGWVHRTEQDVVSRDRDERIFEKTKSRGVALVMTSIATIKERRQGQGVYFEEYALRFGHDAPPVPLPDVEWADLDHRGRLLFVRRGCVYAADIASDGGVTEQLLINLNDTEPSELGAPTWATQW